MVFGTGSNETINMVTILLGIRKLFQDQHTDPFAPHIAIGLGGEGFTVSILRQHTCFARTDMHFGGHEDVDPTDDGHAALTTLDCVYTPVNGDQGTGAGRLNRLARSMQVEKITHAIGSYRRGPTCRRIALNSMSYF